MIRRRVDELRQNMFVIHQLVIRDKKRSLSSTFMGELWEVINPLINMVVMVLVFGKMFGDGNSSRSMMPIASTAAVPKYRYTQRSPFPL
jgi:ABC-type polysaccharide/polyol phosphate export permease